MAFVDMSCYLLSSFPLMGICALHCLRCFGFGSATLLVSPVPFMGVCLQCLGCLSAAGIAPHLCSGLSRHTSRVAFPRNATQGKESSNNNFTAVTRAQLLLSFHDMQNVSQSSPSSPSPLSPGRNGQGWPGAPEGLCSALGNARFSDACMCEASGVQRPPQKIQENAPDSGIFSFPSGSFPDSTAPGKKEPAEAAAALEASARAEVGRRSTSLHSRAAQSAWTCCSRPAPRRRVPAFPCLSQGGFGGVRGGGGCKFQEPECQGPAGRRKM